jgi:hypothetical protein
VTTHAREDLVDPKGHYSNPSSPGEKVNQSGVTWPELINPQVRTAIGELYDHLFGASRNATTRCRRVPPNGSRQVQRRLAPEELEAGYLAGATAVVLAAKHSIHRTTVWPFSNATRCLGEGGC